MKPFFCAFAAQRAGESPGGTAGQYQTYILIECPTPWAAKALDSKGIPPALRRYIHDVSTEKSVRFLCINRGSNKTPKQAVRLLIYEQSGQNEPPSSLLASDNFSSGYRGYEFRLASLDQVISCLEAYWQHSAVQSKSQNTSEGTHALVYGEAVGKKIEKQDILVCTHGMRDKCCAKLGRPVFRGAQRMATKGILPNARVWKTSHIGGHRFAPTAITFPDGRYYGRLSLSALKAALTREGDINQLRPVYRGWGILPQPLQLLEQLLFLQHGWSWLDRSVTYQQLGSKSGSDEVFAKLSVRQTNGTVVHYRARFIRDKEKTYCGKASCGDTAPSEIVKYAIADYSVDKYPTSSLAQEQPSSLETISAS